MAISGATQDPADRREQLAAAAERGDAGDLDLLVAGLWDPHPGVQQAAVTGLIRVGGAEVVERLVGLLREPPAIRNMAVEVIGRVLPGAIEAVLPLLDSPDPHVRRLVVDALGPPCDPRLVGPLTRMLHDPSPTLRASAAEALGRLRVREAVPALTALLDDEEWVVFSAVTALADIGDSSGLAPLLALARRGDGAARAAAVEALARLDVEGTTLPALVDLAPGAGPELRPSLVKALVALAERVEAPVWTRLDRGVWLGILTEAGRGADPELRLAAITGLGRLGDPRGTRAVLDIYGDWPEGGEEVEDRVVAALVGTGDVRELIRAVRPDEDRLCAAAVRALGELRARDAVAALATVRASSRNWELRRLATAALGRIGTPEALDGVAAAVDDETGHVRVEAVRQLGRSGRAADVRALLAKLETERYREVRDQIVDTVLRVARPDLLARFFPLLTHARPEVRESAARAIGLARPAGGLSALLDAVGDPEWSVRQAVVEALGRFDDPAALGPLALAMSDDHEKVRLAAVIGLARWDRPEARQALMTQGLRDPDAWVRYRAVERLGALRAAEAAPLLAAIAAGDREPSLVRRAAAAALAAIGGTSEGTPGVGPVGETPAWN